MKKPLLVIYIFFLSLSVFAQIEGNSKYLFNKTYTYNETYEVYQSLAQKYDKAQLLEMGMSDAGKPIYLFIISADGDFIPLSNKQKGKTVLLINNAIHPGEPCGVDASIKFANDLLTTKNGESLLETQLFVLFLFTMWEVV